VYTPGVHVACIPHRKGQDGTDGTVGAQGVRVLLTSRWSVVEDSW